MAERLVETLEVSDFLSVKDAKITLGNLTAIIGPQASGKSIIAKLFFFGRIYISTVFDDAIMDSSIANSVKAEMLERFLSLFDSLSGFSRTFKISYTYGDYQVSVERRTTGRKPVISHSRTVDRDTKLLRREFEKFSKNTERFKRSGSASRFQFRRENAIAKKLFEELPACLFVPASRAFYSTVSEELFTFLASEERIDPLMAQFGSFYEFAKRRVAGDLYGVESSQSEKEALKSVLLPVMGGEYIRERSKDFIKTDWGRVPLRVSSSGQQEALPLLLTLSQYPKADAGLHGKRKLLVIEEPEAHLFPTAQKYMLDFIVKSAKESDCDILFTTHSPYILACMNNHIAREIHLSDQRLVFSAFYTGEGTAREIIDESGLIDTQDLDEVSTEIANEFFNVFD